MAFVKEQDYFLTVHARKFTDLVKVPLKSCLENEKQKVYAAANSAIRNTGRVLEFNSKASFYKSSALNIPFS